MRLRLAALSVVLSAAACGLDVIGVAPAADGPDAATDASSRPAPGPDAASDANRESPPDAAVDAVADARVDATSEAGTCSEPTMMCNGTCCRGFCTGTICRKPVFWLRSELGVTSTGTFRWEDQSGGGNDVMTNGGTAPTYVPTALAGRPIVRFAGNARLASAAAKTFSPRSADVSWFHVSRNAGQTGADKHQVFGTINPSVNFSGITAGYTTGNLPYGMFRQDSDQATTSSQSTTAWSVIDMRRQAGHYELRVNGGSPKTNDTATLDIQGDRWTVGSQEPNGTEYFNGDVAEIVVFVDTLDDLARTSIAHQLGERYGIAISN